jgi:hypothetical protein
MNKMASLHTKKIYLVIKGLGVNKQVIVAYVVCN